MKPQPTEETTLQLKVIPRSSQSKGKWQSDGSLKIWVKAAPVDGEANAAVVQFLAKAFRVPKSAIEIEKGETSKQKRVRVIGITWEKAHELLP